MRGSQSIQQGIARHTYNFTQPELNRIQHQALRIGL